jgi:hypothetical protein
MISERRRSRGHEAVRGILLLTGLGLMTIAVATVIAAATVALMG